MTAVIPRQQQRSAGAPRLAALTEAELLALAQEGDAGAFGELYRRDEPKLRGFVISKLTGADRGRRAEDITQETFLRAWRTIAQFRDQGHPYATLLRRIACNIVADLYKSGWHRYCHVDTDIVSDRLALHGDTDPHGDPELAALDADTVARHALVRAAICDSAGSPEQAAAVIAWHLDDLPMTGMAEHHGGNQSTAKARVHRGMRQLRRSDSLRRIYDATRD